MNAAFREVCLRCRRPREVCWCEHLVPRPTRARVVLLQHPREAKVPVGTARMAHLSLPNSELHTGVVFEQLPRLAELAARPGTFLLFPGETARDPAQLAPGELEHLVVIDGTWPQARKVLKQNPTLQRLPRLGLVPRRPGNYRIRKEPTADSLATIEAVVELLGVLERDPDRFDEMLRAFEWMVDQQLARAATRTGPPRHKKPRHHPELPERRLLARLSDAVVLHAEVNAHSKASGVEGEPELLHLVAARLGDAERFEAVLAPRRPLAPGAPHHLGVDAERLLAGEAVDAVRDRWRRFLRPGDVLCSWGPYPLERLAKESFETCAAFDLRVLVARRKQSSPGAPLEAARALAGFEADPGAPRAVRTVAALEAVLRGLAATAATAA